jgi:hypothetical protein
MHPHATTERPTVQDPTAIIYDAADPDRRYAVTAYGQVIAHEWSIGAAETARQAWLALYEAQRACLPTIICHGVARIAAAIARYTDGQVPVWHLPALSPPLAPAPGTRFAALILAGDAAAEVELWALTADGRLGTLEMLFEDRPAHPAKAVSHAA